MGMRRMRLCLGVAMVLSTTLAPVGAAAQSYGTGAEGAGHQMAPAGGQQMPAPAHGMAADHHMAGDLHMGPAAGHAPMPPHGHEKKKDTGVVEGGFGSGDNSGGSVRGDDAPTESSMWGNMGGSIH